MVGIFPEKIRLSRVLIFPVTRIHFFQPENGKLRFHVGFINEQY
jgi:hypothetical protein